jgi:branched-subunit amino acid ABC-type transport system permease component
MQTPWFLYSQTGCENEKMTPDYLDPNMVSGILLYGFAAVLLGGIDNPWGAPLGGFFVGVLENIAGATELKLTVGPGQSSSESWF